MMRGRQCDSMPSCLIVSFYHEMHYNANHGLAIACHDLRLSVTLVDQDHRGWKSWKLIVQTISPTPMLFVAQSHPPTPRRTWGNFGETRGGVGENISETRKYRGKVTMEGQ